MKDCDLRGLALAFLDPMHMIESRRKLEGFRTLWPRGDLRKLEIETPRQGFPPAKATQKWAESNCFARNRSTRDWSPGLRLAGAQAEKKWKESARRLITTILSENHEQRVAMTRHAALTIASFLGESKEAVDRVRPGSASVSINLLVSSDGESPGVD